MKAILRTTDSSAMEGEIFCREVNASYDDKKNMIYIKENNQIKEIVNMGSPNFHSLSFISKKKK